MKKLIALGVGLLAVGGVVFGLTAKPIEYNAPEVKETIVEVPSPDRLDVAVEQEKQALEEKYTKMRDLNAEITVLKAERDRIDAQLVLKQKEFGDLLKATSLKN